MNITQLTLKNLKGSAFRSLVVVLCALLVSGFAVSITLIMRGAETSLQLALDRLGADIVVVPAGASAQVETALLMGQPAEVWMPEENLQKIAAISGVAQVSPQLFLSTLADAACCTAPNMFLVAYDPATDFTIQPWLENKIGSGLKLGEVVGGDFIFVPEGSLNILLYGYRVTLKTNLEPTGTGIDQTMFFTFDTARDISRISQTMAISPLTIPEGSISAVMVKLTPGANTRDVAISILKKIPDVTPIESLNMFQSYRKQISGLIKSVAVVLGATWMLSLVVIGLVFSMAANERRREMGVLRALGATRSFILFSLLSEAGLLAIVGGVVGVTLSAVGIFVFRRTIIDSLGIPFMFPDASSLALQLTAGIALTLVSVILSALVPTLRVSQQDPATAMRE